MTPQQLQQAQDQAAVLIRRFEGLFLKPYLCPAGYPTIGYGSRYYLDGRQVALTDPSISKEVAEVMMRDHLRRVLLPAVLHLCPNVDTPERLAALLDFAFNLGLGRFQASTLRKRVNAAQWEAAKVELRKWIYAAGKVMNGLKFRREAEIALI